MKVNSLGAKPGESKVLETHSVLKWRAHWMDGANWWPSDWWGIQPQTKWTAAEYRSPTSLSDGVHPTGYCRKIARVTTSGGGKGRNDTYRYEFDHGSYGLGLSPVYNGQYWTNPGVQIADYLVNDCIRAVWDEFHGYEANLLEDAFQVQQIVDLIASAIRVIVELRQNFRREGLVFSQSMNQLVQQFTQDSMKQLSNQLSMSGGKSSWRSVPKGHQLPTYSNFPIVNRNTIDGAASAWLGYYYGIKPLIGTIQALSQSIAPRSKTFKARRRRKRSISPSGFFSGAPDVANWVLTTGEAEEAAQVEVVAKVVMGSDLARLTSLGLTDMKIYDSLVLAWALTPYSFVVDWILPVENWLRTAMWSSSISLQYGYVGRRITVNAEGRSFNIFDGFNDSGDTPIGRGKAIAYERVALTELPTAGLAMRSSLTSTQVINAAALLWQAQR